MEVAIADSGERVLGQNAQAYRVRTSINANRSYFFVLENLCLAALLADFTQGVSQMIECARFGEVARKCQSDQ